MDKPPKINMKDRLKRFDNRFNHLIKEIYMENKDVFQLLYEANSLKFEATPDSDKPLIIGQRCLVAQQVQRMNTKLFKVPSQFCIPMTIPISFAI